jgi:hypothetical protein
VFTIDYGAGNFVNALSICASKRRPALFCHDAATDCVSLGKVSKWERRNYLGLQWFWGASQDIAI